MYCIQCGVSMEDAGGSQMRDCFHFLCTGCIVAVVKKATKDKISCVGYNGVYRCVGYLEQDELEFMVPDKVYRKYIARLAAAIVDGDIENQGEDLQANDDEPFANLDLTEEEKSFGLAHKISMIDALVRDEGYTFEEAEDHLNMLPILENRAVIRCEICIEDIQPRDGVVLKDCLHMFCKDCLRGHIQACETAIVECPAPDCDEPLKRSEIAVVGGQQEVQRHFELLSLKEAAASMPNVAHCLTPNCTGFVVAEGGVTVFNCPVCRAQNCIACKVLHAGTCAQFRQQIADDQNRALQRQNDQLSENAIAQRLNQRIFMNCPKCNAVIEKNGGCPNMVCHNRGCGHRFVWTGVPA